jgi:hypothetical protein
MGKFVDFVENHLEKAFNLIPEAPKLKNVIYQIKMASRFNAISLMNRKENNLGKRSNMRGKARRNIKRLKTVNGMPKGISFGWV